MGVVCLLSIYRCIATLTWTGEDWNTVDFGSSGLAIMMHTISEMSVHMNLAQMSQDTIAYWPILLLIGLAGGFAFVVIIVTHLLGPKRLGDEKGSVYESGVNPLASARKRFNVRFYLLAMTFLIFDVEIIFLYPWATTFRQIEAGGHFSSVFLWRIMFFIATSVIAYIYAWRKGVFRFD